MKYASLQSLEGHEALARALETPAVQRIASGVLTADDLLGMDQKAIDAGFRLIRWYDSGGIPKCPNCYSNESYKLKKLERWRCAQCRHDYSVTSSTVFSGAKMPLRNYLFALSLVLEPSQFKSIHEFCSELKLGYKSTFTNIQRLRIAKTEGKDGCTTPYAILQRLTWLQLKERQKPERLLYGRSGDLRYPYLKSESKMEGADLVQFANSIVPRWPHEDQRADMCQDVILAILEGTATRESIGTDVKKFITKVMQASPWKYKWISFDAPLGEDGEGTLHDLISNEDAAERYIRVHT